MSRWGFSQQFLAEFQAEREELVKSGTTLDGVNKLRKKLNDALDSLPAYDQRNCHKQIQELESQVIAPKPTKFSFTRKPKTTPTITSSPPTTTAPETTQAVSVEFEEHPLSNITHSIVHIQHELPAVHIHNACHSLIVLTNISGSAILHDVHDSILVISSHQFRIHNSSNTRIHLTTRSTPIIEHSSGLTFNVNDVQDFSHVKPTPSPNWRYDDRSVDVNSILDRLRTPGFNVDSALKDFLR